MSSSPSPNPRQSKKRRTTDDSVASLATSWISTGETPVPVVPANTTPTSLEQQERFVTINELHDLLPEEDSDRNDSDDDSDVEESDDDDDDDDSLFPLDEDVVEFVKPLRPQITSPHEISLQLLRQQLNSHYENRSVGRFLTKVDTEEDAEFVATIEEHSHSLLSSNGLPDAPEGGGPTTLVECWISSKVYGTPLHYACRDPDPKRGEEKIRMILEFATKCGVDMELLLSVREVHFNTGDRYHNWIARKLEHDKRDVYAGTTPLFLLIRNKQSTVAAVKLLCQAWPRAVFLRSKGKSTLLHDMMRKNLSRNDQAGRRRHIALVHVILQTAQKTLGGARSLLESTRERLTGTDNAEDDDLNRDFYEDDSGNGGSEPYTSFHYLCFYGFPDIELYIPLHLKYWPDALLHCEEIDNCCTYPFHHAVTSCGIYDDGIKSHAKPNQLALENLCSFMEYSSLRGLAHALLNVAKNKGLAGFVVARDTLQYSNQDDPHLADSALKQRANVLLGSMLEKRDSEGLGLLHHIAAHSISASEREKKNFRKSDRDPMPGYMTCLQQEIQQIENRNSRHINEVIQWLSQFSSTTNKARVFLSRDGNTPLQHALSMGKTWDRGIESLLVYDSDWITATNTKGYHPLMTAALPESDQDLSTVFELLRYAPQVLSSQHKK